jgi:hypothetical protein
MSKPADPRCLLNVEVPPKYWGSAECGVCKTSVLREGMAEHRSTGVLMCVACTRASFEKVKVLVSTQDLDPLLDSLLGR